MLVFNSLDQIAQRLPLCAKEQMFVSAIVEFLLAERITSIFITGEDPSERSKEYGILPMSDLIVSFYKYFVPLKEFDSTDQSNRDKEMTLLRVEKIAGGINAGKMGFLELKSQPGTAARGALSFSPWEHDIGRDWRRINEDS